MKNGIMAADANRSVTARDKINVLFVLLSERVRPIAMSTRLFPTSPMISVINNMTVIVIVPTSVWIWGDDIVWLAVVFAGIIVPVQSSVVWGLEVQEDNMVLEMLVVPVKWREVGKKMPLPAVAMALKQCCQMSPGYHWSSDMSSERWDTNRNQFSTVEYYVKLQIDL